MNHIFQSIGLLPRESKILTFLIQAQKPLKNREIAAGLGIQRQTVYSIVLNLAKRGLLVQTDLNGIKHFYTDIKEIIKYLDLEQDRLIKAKQTLRGDQDYLIKKVAKTTLPAVHFYDGALGLQKLFETILGQYRKGKHKQFRGYGINYFSHSQALSDYLNYFVKKRASYGVKTNLFIAQGPDGFHITNETNALGRKVKRLKIDPQMAGVYLVGDRVYLFSYKDNVGVMIENQAIVALLKDVFDDHWKRVDN